MKRLRFTIGCSKTLKLRRVQELTFLYLVEEALVIEGTAPSVDEETEVVSLG